MKHLELRKLIREDIARELSKIKDTSKYSHLKDLLKQLMDELELHMDSETYDFEDAYNTIENILMDVHSIEGGEEF